MKPSETMQVTGGLFAVLSFASKSEKGAKKFFITESQREGKFFITESEVRKAIQGVETSRFQKTSVVEFSVDKSYDKAFVVEKL
jgi:hypothetical protein